MDFNINKKVHALYKVNKEIIEQIFKTKNVEFKFYNVILDQDDNDSPPRLNMIENTLTVERHCLLNQKVEVVINPHLFSGQQNHFTIYGFNAIIGENETMLNAAKKYETLGPSIGVDLQLRIILTNLEKIQEGLGKYHQRFIEPIEMSKARNNFEKINEKLSDLNDSLQICLVGHMPLFFFKSKIIRFMFERNTYAKWDSDIFDSILNRNAYLLFESSNSEKDKNSCFHKSCDEKGSTIVIFKQQYSQYSISGGYTSVSWNTKGRNADPFAFLFRIIANENSFEVRKFPILSNFSHRGIYSTSNYGPCFGGDDFSRDFDLCIDGNTVRCTPNSFKINGKLDFLDSGSSYLENYEVIKLD